MDAFRIVGGHPLRGTVRISGSKNAALPILFSSLLGGSFSLSNVPCLRDVKTTLLLLEQLGLKISVRPEPLAESKGFDHNEPIWSDLLEISEGTTSPFEAPYDLVRTMRASVLCLGPLLARRKRARSPSRADA